MVVTLIIKGNLIAARAKQIKIKLRKRNAVINILMITEKTLQT